MGKARIIEALGEGRYTIEIIEARERAEAAKTEAETRIQRLQDEIVSLDERITIAQSKIDQAVNEQNLAISRYNENIRAAYEQNLENNQDQDETQNSDSNTDLESLSTADIERLTAVIFEYAQIRDSLKSEKQARKLMIESNRTIIERVNALPELRQIQAWCADYTEDLSGEVATAEVPGEIGNVIIKPGYAGRNQWSAADDGMMQPALAGTPAGTFYNLAMLPGWQKWRPTYRTATITSLDEDANTCSITIEEARSSQQNLNVNAESSYSDVPILYMHCDAGAFIEGDKVLVAFAGNVDGPTVVGFEEEPQECKKIVPGCFVLPRGDKSVTLDARLHPYYEVDRLHDGSDGLEKSGTFTSPEGIYEFTRPVVEQDKILYNQSRYDIDWERVLIYPGPQSFTYNLSMSGPEILDYEIMSVNGEFTVETSGYGSYMSLGLSTDKYWLLIQTTQPTEIKNNIDVECSIPDFSVRITRNHSQVLSSIKTATKKSLFGPYYTVDAPLGFHETSFFGFGSFAKNQPTPGSIEVNDVLKIGSLEIDLYPVANDIRRPPPNSTFVFKDSNNQYEHPYKNAPNNNPILKPHPIHTMIYVNFSEKRHEKICTVFFTCVYRDGSLFGDVENGWGTLYAWVGVSVKFDGGTPRLVPLDEKCNSDFRSKALIQDSKITRWYDNYQVFDGFGFYTETGALRPQSEWPYPPVN